MTTQLIEDLKETRRQLEINGRCKAYLENDEGKVCLDGAVAKAIGIMDVRLNPVSTIRQLDTNPRAVAVLDALKAQIPSPVFHPSSRVAVYFFNDLGTTTDEDCFNLIDKALAEVGGL